MRPRNIETPDPGPFELRKDGWEETFEVTVITPIYGGGVKAGEPDREMPIRASAIRGHLRYWWRLIAAYRKDNPLGGEALFAAERDLWGGMSEDKKDYSSKVRVRIQGIEGILVKDYIEPCTEYERDPENLSQYKRTPVFNDSVHPYAIFPAQGKLTKDRKGKEVEPSDIIREGFKFSLTISCPTRYRQEVISALRWWVSFGGIGARTRRGLGSIEIATIQSVRKEELENFRQIAMEFSGSGCHSAIAAWKSAIEILHKFRQGVDVGRNTGNGNRPGQSRWPESDSIRKATGKHRIKHDGVSFSPKNTACGYYPRIVFGLPIIFHFQNDKTDLAKDPEDCVIAPSMKEAEDRMASPVIVKAVPYDGKYFSVALLLPIDHFDQLDIALKSVDKENHKGILPRDIPRTRWWPVAEEDQNILSTYTNSPLKNRGNDALSAFITYFKKG